MPLYNSAVYLNDSISSILHQTFTDFELLLLDDGSEDMPNKVIELFDDSRIKYYRENENKGIVYQLNKGIELSTGRYIARMDADDISLPNRFEVQFKFLEDIRNRNIEVLGTDAITFGEQHGEIRHLNYRPKQVSFLLKFYCPLLHPTVMMRKSIFTNKRKYSEDFIYCEDFALWRLIDNGRNIAILDVCLLKYRIHQNQTNTDCNRLILQKKSFINVLRLSKMKSFSDLILKSDENLKILSADLFFGNRSTKIKIKFLTRIYIWFCKRKLKLILDFSILSFPQFGVRS